jgi:hypothetical protein
MTKETIANQTSLKERESMQLTLRQSAPALLVIGLGVLLLTSNLFGFHLIDILWPAFVVVPGLLLLTPAYNSTPERQSRFAFLAVPGALFLTIGLLLFAMNLANEHFEAWAYSWTLLVAAVPAALMYIKRFEPEHRIHTSGRKLVRMMTLAFMGLAVFFEIVVFENFNPLLPLVMIVYGIYLLRKQRVEEALGSY